MASRHEVLLPVPARAESKLVRDEVDNVLQRAAGRKDAATAESLELDEPGARYIDFLVPGLLGMPRRIYTYEADRGWAVWNLIVTIGVVFQTAGILVFLANLVRSYRHGAIAGSDPWDAWTLEWSTTSPPPEYNFAVLPTVKSRRPLWDIKHPEDPDWRYE